MNGVLARLFEYFNGNVSLAENVSNNLDQQYVHRCEAAGKLIYVGVNDNLCE